MRNRYVQFAGDGIRVNAGNVFAGVCIFAARTVIGHVEAEQIGGIFRHHVPTPDFGVGYVIGHGCRGGKVDAGGDVIFRFGVEIAGFKFERIARHQQIVKAQAKSVFPGFVGFRA